MKIMTETSVLVCSKNFLKLTERVIIVTKTLKTHTKFQTPSDFENSETLRIITQLCEYYF